jgi:HK97 family phage major capsid protein
MDFAWRRQDLDGSHTSEETVEFSSANRTLSRSIMATAAAQSQRDFIDRLTRQRDTRKRDAERILAEVRSTGRTDLQAREDRHFRAAADDIKVLNRRISDETDDLKRMGGDDPMVNRAGGLTTDAHAQNWGRQTAELLRRSLGGGSEARAVVSGSIDVPALVEPSVAALPRPQRLTDLLIDRQGTQGHNAFEFFQATVRTNTATAVADYGLKPTSTNTVRAVQDRCRVIAHLSEPAPIRLWFDIPAFATWLTNEMVQGVLDGLEFQIVRGDGTGENMAGLLSYDAGTTPLTTHIGYTTDLVTTLRSAVTALQIIGVVPTAWVLNPVDAASLDLIRWSTAGGFLTGGYENDHRDGFGSSDNVFGTTPRVVSPSVPQGTAILGDWTGGLRLYVADEAHFDIDASGTLFTHNEFLMRGEGRFGVGVLQPSRFAVIDLTP